ncbi:MAG: SAF domain-containing protein [Actinobacteria bacterium]|nr:SAF domain-containing protein [Actinomycetota bacterium]
MASLTGTTPTTSNGQGRKIAPAFSPARAPRLAVRNRARVAGGAILLCLSALVGMGLFADVGNRRPVLAVARPVAAGQTLAAADLKVVRVSADPGVRTVPASDLSRLIGQPAGVALAPGALLAPAQLGSGPALPPGSMVVGAVLKPGQFPLGLRAGDTVRLVLLPAAGAVAADPATEQGGKASSAIRATVAAFEKVPDSAGTMAVSLAVVPEMAPAVAAAGAQGYLSVMRELP